MPTVSAPNSSLGLSLPSAHEEPEIHLERALPARSVPPSGFGYPRDGLLPSIPCRSCFIPAALMGFRPSELSPSPRYRAVSDIDAPACCFSCRCSRMPKHRAGPTGRSFQVLTLAEVPGEPDLIRAGIRWMLPWASPFQGSLAEALTEGSRPGLLSRACHRDALDPPCDEPGALSEPAPQSFDRPRPGPIRPQRTSRRSEDQATLIGFSCRLAILKHSRVKLSGLCVHLLLRRALLSASSNLGRCFRSTGAEDSILKERLVFFQMIE
jgi:hypothetical protein